MKFRVTVPVSGYSRGYQVYEVEADSIDQAKEGYWAGKMVEDEIVRDDREHNGDEDIEVEEIL